MTRLWAVLSSGRATALVVVAGLLLTAPSLGNGVALDDRFHRALVVGYAPIHRAPTDLFHFISDEPTERRVMLDRGVIPWTASERVKAAFFRPLSSLSVYLDYAVLPDLPWLFHLESLALYGALIALVLSLYRAVLPSAPLAALAGLLFAVDDAHGIAVGWLANRNALFAAVFGIAAVLLHHRAASRGFRPGWVLAPLCLLLALLSGEVALGAVGYLVAYAVAFDPAPLGRRLASLAPYGVVVLAWRLAALASGAGVRASGFYVDPFDSPLRFLASFPGRLLVVLLAQVGLPSADLWFVWAQLPLLARVVVGSAAFAVVCGLGWVLAPVLREHRGARFCALGMMLGLCLSTVTAPADRNLLLAGVGAFGLIALAIGTLAAQPQVTRPALWLRRAFIGVHLVLAPLALPFMSCAPGLLDSMVKSRLMHFKGEPGLSKQTLVAVNLPNLVITAFYWATPAEAGEPAPLRVRSLAPTADPIEVAREDARTILVTLQPGHFTDPTSTVFRDPGERFSEGERVVTPGVTFTVVRIDGRGRPLAVRCEFDVPLEDPSLRWVAWTGALLVDFRPPGIGEATWTGPH